MLLVPVDQPGVQIRPIRNLAGGEAMIKIVRERGLRGDRVLRNKIAQAWATLRIMELNNDRLLQAVLEGRHPGPESSIGKLYWATWHQRFGELMVEVIGPDAMLQGSNTRSDQLVRSFLNSRAEIIYGGASEIQHNILGERVLGLPR